ncbi:MAG: glycosyltransferase family 4 protein [bacterium]
MGSNPTASKRCIPQAITITMTMRAKKSKAHAVCIHIITRMDKGGSAENTYLTVKNINKFRPLLIIGPTTESTMSEKERRERDENMKALVSDGIQVRVCPFLFRRISLLNDLRAFLWLFFTIRKLHPAIVHTHTSKAGILGRWAAFLNRVPFICHTPHGHIFFGYFHPLIMTLFLFLERITSLITQRIICLTEGEKKDIIKLRIAPESKLFVCPSGIDTGSFKEEMNSELTAQWRKRLGINEDDIVVGTVGRLVKIKGHIFLLKAFHRLLPAQPNLLFCFVGSGPLKKELTRKAEGWGIIDRVRFIPWEADIRPILSLFDIFVFPSLNEGMGRALVEAMTMKKPAVATRISGIPDLVHEGINGLLVPPADARALGEAILWLAERPEERKRMGEAGEIIADTYSVDAMIEILETIYCI